MSDIDYEPEVISCASLRRILASLPAGVREFGPMCDIAAHGYLSGKTTVAAGTGRGVKADLRAMHREVLRTKVALDPTRMEILVLIGLFGGESAIPRFTALKDEFGWLEATLAKAVNRRIRRMPKSHPNHLLLAIGILISVFERATKTRATHSLHRDGQYVGEPLSPFGKFVIAFFAEVDPGLERRTLGSAIRASFSMFPRGGERIDESEDVRTSPH